MSLPNAEVRTGSRTVDLLLEMQDKPAAPGLSASARVPAQEPPDRTNAKPAGSLAVARPVATVPPGGPPRAVGLFGTSDVPQAPHRAAALPDAPWRGGGSALGAGGSRGGGAPSAHGAGFGRWLLLPRDVLNWVREHRGTVVTGAVAALLLVWVASLASSRRRG